jgi:hypothetical protein
VAAAICCPAVASRSSISRCRAARRISSADDDAERDQQRRADHEGEAQAAGPVVEGGAGGQEGGLVRAQVAGVEVAGLLLLAGAPQAVRRAARRSHSAAACSRR